MTKEQLLASLKPLEYVQNRGLYGYEYEVCKTIFGEYIINGYIGEQVLCDIEFLSINKHVITHKFITISDEKTVLYEKILKVDAKSLIQSHYNNLILNLFNLEE